MGILAARIQSRFKAKKRSVVFGLLFFSVFFRKIDSEMAAVASMQLTTNSRQTVPVPFFSQGRLPVVDSIQFYNAFLPAAGHLSTSLRYSAITDEWFPLSFAEISKRGENRIG